MTAWIYEAEPHALRSVRDEPCSSRRRTLRFCGCPTPSEGWVRALQGRRCTRYEARIAQKKEGGPWHVQDPPCCASAEPVLASAVFYCAVTVTVPRFIAAAPLAWAMTAT
jgi:hypothetical protein